MFDQNLSRKLVNRLADIFPGSSHVQFHELAEKTDTEIWGFAKVNDFCIVHISQGECNESWPRKQIPATVPAEDSRYNG
ncbi:DUF5615 family PIN-like protein [Leptolyngbya sp. PCC 6406]|uniref:DUF5615 family PIN-like protein n=1 Tax=Leptolyngbya sp. PCC 6406 TaxID=1173264 RepID=UPI0021F23C85|nr:DUF5615 family PIN-like protein [Leptolyngbya sp. PCC 6406]